MVFYKNMLKLSFSIDKYQLAYYFCLKYFGDEQAPQEWLGLEKELKDKFGATAGFLFFQPKHIGFGLNWVGFPNTSVDRFIRDQKIILEIFECIFQSAVFEKVLAETEEYKVRVEQEWNSSQEVIMSHFRDITGMDVNEEIRVVILHPILETGSYMENNLIEWGFADTYPQSQSVGLAHELLHVATNVLRSSLKEEEQQWRLHALIRLAIDEELRARLHPEKPEYFQEKNTQGYHERLIETAKRFLPEWREYLKQEPRNLTSLFEKIRG